MLPEHYRALYDITLQQGVASRWEPSLQGGSFEGWVRRLFDGVHCQFTVVSLCAEDMGAVCGLVRCYGANFRHGTAQVAMFMAEETHTSGEGVEAIGIFVDFLFARYPFRKVYGESIAFNYSQFASGVGRLFQLEGVLKAHEVHLGMEYDCMVLAIHRAQWQAFGARLVERLCRRKQL